MKNIILSLIFISTSAYSDTFSIGLSSVDQEVFSTRLSAQWSPHKPVGFLKYLGSSYGLEYGQKDFSNGVAHEYLVFTKTQSQKEGMGMFSKISSSYLKLPEGSSKHSLSPFELEFGIRYSDSSGGLSFEIGQGIRFGDTSKNQVQVGDTSFETGVTMYPSIRYLFSF